MELQDRIKLLREEKGLTQEELAKYLNVARATISGYETKGKQPDIDKLIKMSNIFKVSLDYLICGKVKNKSTDFIKHPDNESLIDDSVYNIYSQLDYTSKKDLERYLQYLHYRQLRPTDTTI